MKINKYSLISIALLGLLSFGATALADDGTAATTNSDQLYPYEKTYTITAYYSPIEGQKRYLKGSLAADKKLNGNGVHGADGTPVYAGMIAAPKNIAFETKMKIPGLGIVAVHDRGGAIVHAGERGGQYDRLDVWMGYGDEGLNRALRWGKRQVGVTVYGVDDTIAEKIDLQSLNSSDLPGQAVSKTSNGLTFQYDYGFGDQNEEIKAVKTSFQKLGYFKGAINDQFDSQLYQAVVAFQLKYEIIDTDSDFGAGYFGPQTRRTLEEALSGQNPTPQEVLTIMNIANAANTDAYAEAVSYAGNGLSFLAKDLKPGDSGPEVVELQTELKKLNLFGLDPTGNYGDVTAHAVFKFQQSRGLVATLDSPGAGTFGPITRGELMALVNSRIEIRKVFAGKEDKEVLLAKN